MEKCDGPESVCPRRSMVPAASPHNGCQVWSDTYNGRAARAVIQSTASIGAKLTKCTKPKKRWPIEGAPANRIG